MSAPRLGSLTLSIDWELEIGRGSAANCRWVDDLTPELVALLDSLQLPATWGVADPARSAATESILASTQPHELAVLGDRSWLGWGAGGSRASRELSRRILGASARQIPIRSLLLHHEASIAHAVPLTELGIRTIRQPIGHEQLQVLSLAGAPRGLNVAERVQRLTLPSWWRWWGHQSQLSELLQPTSLFGSKVCHLGFDAQQLCTAGPRGLHRLAGLLTELATLRDQMGWQMMTMQQWTATKVATGRQAA